MMDAIKDYGKSDKFWFWRKIKGTKYELWGTYGSHVALFGLKYNPAYPWSSDGWHTMKHGELLGFSGAIACLWAWIIAMTFNLKWYLEIPIQLILWWALYRIEGMIFNKGYDKLK